MLIQLLQCECEWGLSNIEDPLVGILMWPHSIHKYMHIFFTFFPLTSFLVLNTHFSTMTGKKCKYKTMTKQAKQHLHHGPENQTKILKPKHQEEWVVTLAAERHAIIQGLPFYILSKILIQVYFIGYSQEQWDDIEMMDLDAGYGSDKICAIAHILPPGEEGWHIDCEGGELHIFEGLEEDLAKAKGLYV